MRFAVRSRDLAMDAWLEDYVRTTVVFAVWHYEPDVESVQVRVEGGTAGAGASKVRCGIEVGTRSRGPVRSEATGNTAWKAVQAAAEAIEVALYPRVRGALPAPQPRLAA